VTGVTFQEFFNGFKQQATSSIATNPLTLEFIEMAIELIDEFIPEPNAIWKIISNDTVVDPNKPWEVTRGSTSNRDVKIVFLPDNLEDRQLLRYLKATERNEGNVNGIMYRTDFDPKLKDIVLWQNRELVVNAIDPIQPFDNVIIYMIEFGL